MHAAMGMVGEIIVNNSFSEIDSVTSESSSFMKSYQELDSHTIFKDLIDYIGLDSILSSQNSLTIFAPTDDAFNLLPVGTLDAILNDVPQLTNLLIHHIINDSATSKMFVNDMVVTTLFGVGITLNVNSNGIFLSNYSPTSIIFADLIANNGVVHVINNILIADFGEDLDDNNYSQEQPQINYISPNVGQQGQTLDVIISGTNINFSQDYSDMGLYEYSSFQLIS